MAKKSFHPTSKNPLQIKKQFQANYFQRSAIGLMGWLCGLGMLTTAMPSLASEACPAALDQLGEHTVSSGETLSDVAGQYRLLPETILRFNSGVSASGALPVGRTLSIPPYNGQVVSASAGDTWQTLAERYDSRADLLFEINGCEASIPSRIFIPGALPIAASVSQPTSLQLPGYPLSSPAQIQMNYGWQPHSVRDELVFNSGMAFAVTSAMDVRAVGQGTVAFVGDREGYGRLVVVNHAQGLQTRYANLGDISVTVGQPVTAATILGSIGATGTTVSSPTFLYFEVRTNSASGWVAQDPGDYLPALELR